MKIAKVDLAVTKIPVIRPHKMAIGTTLHQENVVVRVVTDDGIEGFGEAPHMVGHSLKGECQETVRRVLETRLIPAVLGLSPWDLEAIQQRMDKAMPVNPRAKSALNLACYDILGKATGTPVCNLIGGRFRDRIPLSWSVPIVETEAAVREAVERVGLGWRVLKVKVGRGDWLQDLEVVGAIRDAVGREVSIRVDANQAYDLKTAMCVAERLASYGVDFFEQPVVWWDIEGMAEITRSSTVRIMADESVNTPDEMVQIVRRRAADVVSIYVSNSAGILLAKKMINMAESAGIAAYIGGALESVIGACAGLHLAASSPGVTFGCEMVGQFLLVEDIGKSRLGFEDGCLVVPDKPGLGCEVDYDVVGRYGLPGC